MNRGALHDRIICYQSQLWEIQSLFGGSFGFETLEEGKQEKAHSLAFILEAMRTLMIASLAIK
jgi:hypothetical protein